MTTYVSLHIYAFLLLHPNKIPHHPPHEVLTADDELLSKVP